MPSGGKRKGAGRPKGSGKYNEPTRAVRLPASKIKSIFDFLDRKGLNFPLFSNQSGTEEAKENIALETYLIERPEQTRFFRIEDDSMTDSGIFPGAILVAETGLEAQNGDIVIAIVEGKFLVRRLFVSSTKIELRAENKRYPVLSFPKPDDLNLWAVVKKVLYRY